MASAALSLVKNFDRRVPMEKLAEPGVMPAPQGAVVPPGPKILLTDPATHLSPATGQPGPGYHAPPQPFTGFGRRVADWFAPPAEADALASQLRGTPVTSFADVDAKVLPLLKGLSSRGLGAVQFARDNISKMKDVGQQLQVNNDLVNHIDRWRHEKAFRHGRIGQVSDIAMLSLLLGGGYGLYKGIPKLMAMRRKNNADTRTVPATITAGSHEEQDKSAAVEGQPVPGLFPGSSAPSAPAATSTPPAMMSHAWSSPWDIDWKTAPLYLGAAALPFALASGGVDKLTNMARAAILKRRRAKAVNDFRDALTGASAEPKVACLIECMNRMADGEKSAMDANTLVNILLGGAAVAGAGSLIGGFSLGNRIAAKTDPDARYAKALGIAMLRRRMREPVKLELMAAEPGDVPAAAEASGGNLDLGSTYEVPIYLPPGKRARTASESVHGSALDLTKMSSMWKRAEGLYGPQMAASGAIPRGGATSKPLTTPAPANQSFSQAHPWRAKALDFVAPGASKMMDTAGQINSAVSPLLQPGENGGPSKIDQYKQDMESLHQWISGLRGVWGGIKNFGSTLWNGIGQLGGMMQGGLQRAMPGFSPQYQNKV